MLSILRPEKLCQITGMKMTKLKKQISERKFTTYEKDGIIWIDVADFLRYQTENPRLSEKAITEEAKQLLKQTA